MPPKKEFIRWQVDYLPAREFFLVFVCCVMVFGLLETITQEIPAKRKIIQ